VVADLVAIGQHPFDELRALADLFTDDEEGGMDALRFEGIKNLGRPLGVGTIIDREGDFRAVQITPPEKVEVAVVPLLAPDGGLDLLPPQEVEDADVANPGDDHKGQEGAKEQSSSNEKGSRGLV
jgi:hypothetical protein